MPLPANYNRILYKFRAPELNSEREFLRIKSEDLPTYRKKIKQKIKKERLIYIRHHWSGLISFTVSTMIVVVMLLYCISVWNLSLFSSAEQGSNAYIWLFIFLISLITSIIYYLRGFVSSLVSFIKYIKEKLKYYHRLKSRIDECEDYYSFKKYYGGH